MDRNYFVAAASALLCTLLSATTPQALVAAAPAIAGSPTLGSNIAIVPAVRQITQQIDNSQRRTLTDNTDMAVVSGADLGPVEDDFQMGGLLLTLRRSPERERAFASVVDQLHDPNSPNFHRWLRADEIGELYGPAPDDITTVETWLIDQGFSVHGITMSGLVIEFSGSAGQVSQAFGTQLHRYNVGGKVYIANDSDPSLPEALLPAVVGVVKFGDHPRRLPLRKAAGAPAIPSSDAASVSSIHAPLVPEFAYIVGGSTFQNVVPGDFNTIYNVGPVWSRNIRGAGQTIAVVESSLVKNVSDITTFRNTFGLGVAAGFTGTVTQTAPTGSLLCSPAGVTNLEYQAAGDAEWAGAAAPDATIILASCVDPFSSGNSALIAAQNLIDSASPPNILTYAEEQCEASAGATANQNYVNLWQQAAAEGITVFVAAGTGGAASCDFQAANGASNGLTVNGVASTPYNVAVGATEFTDVFNASYGGPASSTYWFNTNDANLASAIRYIPEAPWNFSCAGEINYKEAHFLQPYYSSGSNAGFCNAPPLKRSLAWRRARVGQVLTAVLRPGKAVSLACRRPRNASCPMSRCSRQISITYSRSA